MSTKIEELEFPITPNYSPIVPLEIVGVRGDKQIVAIVDTGFTGFLQIPLTTGISANLRLWGIRPVRLADGRTVKNIECIGSIRFAGIEKFGFISLSETGEDCLLGMQFLNELNVDFIVSPSRKKAIFRIARDEPPSESDTPKVSKKITK